MSIAARARFLSPLALLAVRRLQGLSLTLLIIPLVIAPDLPAAPLAQDSALAGLLLPEAELAGAAAACGIGIASTDTQTGEGAVAGDPVRSDEVKAEAGLTFGIGKWVASLVLNHSKGMLLRNLGRDEQYNRHLAVTQQLREIKAHLQVLDERFDQLGEQLRIQEFRKLNGELIRDYVLPVRNGLDRLQALECAEARVLNAEIMGRDPSGDKLALSQARANFKRMCERHAFDEIPVNLTANFDSQQSILSRYLEAVTLPRRYLTHADSVAFDDFFQRYHLAQIESLQIEAECQLRFPPAPIKPDHPDLPRSVVNNVYEKEGSLLRLARMDVLADIMPDLLPNELVVLDWQTGTLWLNQADFGVHPLVNERLLFPARTIRRSHDIAGPNGHWRFELAPLQQIEVLATLNAAMPQARSGGQGIDRYPATLKPFLREIGLNRVAERIPDSGNLSFVWTADAAVPIRRCHNRLTAGATCDKWYDPRERLGSTAATAPAAHPTLRASSGHVWYAPLQCRPNDCSHQRQWVRGVLSVCKDPRQTARGNACVADAVVTEWQATGLYRANTLAEDRFFKVDLQVLRRR